MKKYSILFICLLITLSHVVAQVKPVSISVDFKDLSIQDFVKEIESKANYHFYYNPIEFDSIRVTLSARNESVSAILRLAFRNTSFSYTIDPNNNVFLTKGVEILASLPYGIFENEKDSLSWQMQKEPELIAELTGTVEQGNLSSALENKQIQIGNKTAQFRPGNVTLVGYVRDAKTGVPEIGAAVFVESPRISTYTNQFGYYTLVIPRGPHILNIKALGIQDTKRNLMIYSDGKLDVEIQTQVLSLREVVISAEKSANVRNVQMGVEKLSISSIKQVPVAFGEADIVKVMLTLPGVKSVGEASNGFNVRGGAVDQNLILFDDLTIYNPSHFFGFFSAFNPDVIKDVELYKSSIPSRYGGRLSSVLDVNSRDGNTKKLSGTAGIGLLTGRLNIEGPIIKDKTSFILGGRTTYSNWLLKMLPESSGYKDAKASFSDLNLRISHEINNKNNLYLSGYLSDDNSNLGSDTTFAYGNQNLSMKWKHIFSNKVTGVFVGGLSRYQYNNNSIANPTNAYKMAFDIQQANFKSDFNYYLSSKHTIDFGISTIRYDLNPGTFQPIGSQSLVKLDVLAPEQAFESAIYVGDRFDLSSNLSMDLGVRYSMYNYMGPQSVNLYAPNLPKSESNVIGTASYKKGEMAKTYHGPELRLSARYQLSEDFSVKAGYNTLRQYIHLLTNTTAISPTDIWKLSDPNIRPQYGDQTSLGFYKNFKDNTIETSIEGYFKNLKDYLDYKSGANLILNHHIETDVINTKGKAYGVEFLVKKVSGKLNGWMGYTYSRTLLKMDDPNAGQIINGGKYYPANYDKPHDFSLVANYRFSHRFSASFNTAYSTGRPITVPIGKYFYAGSLRANYSDRNALRAPDYFRTDFSIIIDGNHKVNQLTHNSWTFGIYNVTGRDNAYSTYFVSEKGLIKGYQLSIFGSAIPFVNYNIRF
ncbi:MAG: TonB-dependent receptor [Sphingobacteriales bacterium 17-39-43]|uniref:TonB-dependent receptor n=1 Tax=Daejeonella sp. TaxID=2805397 RepID=UPI000BDD9A8B|nr:TonB-dependent receptor [Daejeonella sp.]OYZ29836.1 MAG: TonB-dependent receptor [Sphingobacteriales bacterium 16-39-50]OZA22690.1 MAG: TonB-dependent receptor [Sphingobacteriales bacterium 17-39-43]HQT24344.1 TonB-dependent receptor [Daejeonella sp.]HQT59137.1 TonB-dependent receptor [Daejeonella sp.]